MNKYENIDSLPVTIDPVGIVLDVCPHEFITVVSGMIVGSFLSYWKHSKCVDLAQQLDIVIKNNGVVEGVDEYWAQTVKELVEVAKAVTYSTDDPEFMTVSIFLSWLRDGLIDRFAENL